VAGAKTKFRQAQADETWEARRGDRSIFWRFQSFSNVRLERRFETKVEQRALYAHDHLVLELHSEEPRQKDLDHLLEELSWVRMPSSIYKPTLHLSVSPNYRGFRIPRNCREVLRTDDFLGLEVGDDFYLTDASSLFHLRPGKGEGYAQLAPSFFVKPTLTQGNFWCFGLLKLLRPLGSYSLHAAGLATQDGSGVLLVGGSGSAKSTLAIGMIREGWNYLSDDAVLLTHGSQGVQATSCRRSFYIDAVRSSDYADLSLGEEAPDSNGGQRRQVGIDEAYSEQYVPRCLPRILIFPHIKSQYHSTVTPMDTVHALKILLTQSAPQLFDRSTMAGHLELLKRLLQQTEKYELEAGSDLYHEPAKLVDLLKQARGERHGANCH
jgi:hypothetical protein